MAISGSASNHDSTTGDPIFCGSHIRAMEGVQFAKGRWYQIFREKKFMFDIYWENKEVQQEMIGKVGDDLKPMRTFEQDW